MNISIPKPVKQVSTKGGKKLRRCGRHSPSRRLQPYRTARNKINALKRHMALTKNEQELARCDELIKRWQTGGNRSN